MLDVICRPVIALGSSADSPVFDDHERRPTQTLRCQGMAIARMSESDQTAIRVLLDPVIVKNQVAGASSAWPSSRRFRCRRP